MGTRNEGTHLSRLRLLVNVSTQSMSHNDTRSGASQHPSARTAAPGMPPLLTLPALHDVGAAVQLLPCRCRCRSAVLLVAQISHCQAQGIPCFGGSPGWAVTSLAHAHRCAGESSAFAGLLCYNPGTSKPLFPQREGAPFFQSEVARRVLTKQQVQRQLRLLLAAEGPQVAGAAPGACSTHSLRMRVPVGREGAEGVRGNAPCFQSTVLTCYHPAVAASSITHSSFPGTF